MIRLVRVQASSLAIALALLVASCSDPGQDCIEELATVGPELVSAAESLDLVPGQAGRLRCDDTSGPPIWLSWVDLPDRERATIESKLDDAGWALLPPEPYVARYEKRVGSRLLHVEVESFLDGRSDVTLQHAEP